jgi:hypothetical protein
MTFFNDLLHGVRDTSLIEASSVRDFLLRELPEHGYRLDDQLLKLIEEADEIFDRAKFIVRRISTGYRVVDTCGRSRSAPFETYDAACMHGDAIRVVTALEHLAETVSVRVDDEEAAVFIALLGLQEGRNWITDRSSARVRFPVRCSTPPSQSRVDVHRQWLGLKRAAGLRTRSPSGR